MFRSAFVAVLFLHGFASAQLTDAEKKATLSYIVTLQDLATGAYKVEPGGKPGLRATSGAVRSFGYIGAKKFGVELPNLDKTRAFVLASMDPMGGGWQEPGGKPDVTITSIGLMTAAEIGFPAGTYPRSLDYLKANAATFEDVRIGAAAMDSLKKKPEWVDAWIKLANAQLNNDGTAGKGDGQARDTASVAAMKLRLGYPLANKTKVIAAIRDGQRADGGWGKADAKASDLETTYRVMRALMLLKEKPKDVKALNAWLSKHRNTDGGYAMEPGKPSSMSAVYYVSAIGSFLEK
ncbi:hypothetical protein BH11PLA2_BH11PLA2_00840 [soil metagenome]